MPQKGFIMQGELLIDASLKRQISLFLQEDDLERNFYYNSQLPQDRVICSLKLKDNLIVAGMPYFIEVFKQLGGELDSTLIEKWEGRRVSKGDSVVVEFSLPFSVALTGERVALNLLQRASAIATYTDKYVQKAKKYNIAIIDTRKTTPGLRALEKYAVRVGGGLNHRLGQTDMWMVKDNHKQFFGGVVEAVDFFRSVGGFYTPILVEIHDLGELAAAQKMNIRHVMLDNFSPDMIREAVKIKRDMTYEVSGGIRLNNLDDYLIEGVDAISIGALTYDAPHVDISLKYKRG
jgi:nicotinate-nucleotide pyrophosphorylase (carboxylating)